MSLLIIFLLLILTIIIHNCSGNHENFKIHYLSPIIINNNKTQKQLPWCNKWQNKKHYLNCYVNKHLQRKCIWSC